MYLQYKQRGRWNGEVRSCCFDTFTSLLPVPRAAFADSCERRRGFFDLLVPPSSTLLVVLLSRRGASVFFRGRNNARFSTAEADGAAAAAVRSNLLHRSCQKNDHHKILLLFYRCLQQRRVACMHALVRRTYLPVALKEPRHNRECRTRRFQVSRSALPGAAPQFYLRVANHLGFSLCRRELAQRKFSNNNHPHPPGCCAAANAKLKRISISFFWFRFSRRRPRPSRTQGPAGGSCVEAVGPFCRSQALSFGSAVDRRLLLNYN